MAASELEREHAENKEKAAMGALADAQARLVRAASVLSALSLLWHQHLARCEVGMDASAVAPPCVCSWLLSHELTRSMQMRGRTNCRTLSRLQPQREGSR